MKLVLVEGRMRLALCVGLLAGCSGEAIDQPTSPELAMELHVRLAEEAPAAATEMTVYLAPVHYCPFSISSGSASSPDTSTNSIWWPLDRTAPTMTVPVASGGDPDGFGCTSWGAGQTVPLVRFFDPHLLLRPSALGPAVPWTPHDAIIAYADVPVSFTPFGPTDQPIVLGAGYSILRRICGTAGTSWQLQVDSLDARIDFYPPEPFRFQYPPPSVSALLEQSERKLLSLCGVEPPPLNLGRQVSFDRAASLAFSADEQKLLYLLPIDTEDPAHGAPLRSIDLASDSIQQLAIVPYGRSVQTAATGDIFVPTDTSPVQVQVLADGTVTPKTLAIPNWGGVSPDGHWISYYIMSTDPAQGESNMLWDLSTGVGRLAGGPAQAWMDWSPASELVECESRGFTCDFVAPETGIILRQFSSPSLGLPPVSGDLDFHWGTNDEPVLLAAPVLWYPQQTVRAPNPPGAVEGTGELDFGLILQDLGSNGDAVQVLPPEAGLTSYGTSTAGTALIWARKCQGLYETVCSYYLHRITLPGGADQIVAVGDSAAPVAISVSGHRFAIAALDGIHIGDLP
jgi:hypothetical protein